jgi:hypothetical protein
MEQRLTTRLDSYGIPHKGEVSNPYFHTFGTSFVSLFVGITTANYPDVSMPAMMAMHGSSIGFVIYMVRFKRGVTVYARIAALSLACSAGLFLLLLTCMPHSTILTVVRWLACTYSCMVACIHV